MLPCFLGWSVEHGTSFFFADALWRGFDNGQYTKIWKRTPYPILYGNTIEGFYNKYTWGIWTCKVWMLWTWCCLPDCTLMKWFVAVVLPERESLLQAILYFTAGQLMVLGFKASPWFALLWAFDKPWKTELKSQVFVFSPNVDKKVVCWRENVNTINYDSDEDTTKASER